MDKTKTKLFRRKLACTNGKGRGRSKIAWGALLPPSLQERKRWRRKRIEEELAGVRKIARVQ